MSQVIVDDALLREPNLWIPGKKPVGPVKIDWGHPLANSVIGFFIYNKAGIELFDIANNLQGTKTVAAGNVNNSIWKGNQVIKSSNSGGSNSDYIQITNDYINGRDGYLTLIYILSKPVATGDKVYPGTFGRYGTAKYTGIVEITSIVRTSFNSTADYQRHEVSWPITGTINNSISVSFSHPSTTRLWYDGIEQTATSTASDTWAGTVFGGHTYYMVGDIATSYINYYGPVYIQAMIAINRVLDDGEIKSLENDPYQFLIPA